VLGVVGVKIRFEQTGISDFFEHVL
jgi:hypothetical protein